MKKATYASLITLLAACGSNVKEDSAAHKLSYDTQPTNERVIELSAPLIRSTLKDPDSLKNMTVTNSYPCYASKKNFLDNVSPKHDYGYWCYQLRYFGTNSYGGYVPGESLVVYFKGQVSTPSLLGETVRHTDNPWRYHN